MPVRFSHLRGLIYAASCLMYDALCNPQKSWTDTFSWFKLSNMPYHQNAVLHSYTHTLGLHTAPDKCSLQWKKHGYCLPYKIFIPDILWLNWSCLCCTPLMHHMRYIRLKWTRI